MQELEKIIGYKFNDKKILERALTHSSYTKKSDTPDNNERLEFLGDAVLELIISEFLFKNYKKVISINIFEIINKGIYLSHFLNMNKQYSNIVKKAKKAEILSFSIFV